jgi:hypothetical protein
VTILNADADIDLAILWVDAEDEIPLQISPNADFKPGQRVYTIGHPLGFDKTLSEGLISAVPTTYLFQKLQITAPVSEGSSGGPVLDKEGHVVGVVYGSCHEGQNLNYAVGRETFNEFLALEESPRQLAVAGSYVLWRVVLKWAMTAGMAVFWIAVGGCAITLAVVGIIRFWQALCWLWESRYRLLKASYRRVLRPTAQTWKLLCGCRYWRAVGLGLIGGTLLIILGGWLSSASVTSATNPTVPSKPMAVRVASATATDTQTVTVYITRTGTKYHRAGCRYLSKSKIPIPLTEAKQHYGPCSVCRPKE